MTGRPQKPYTVYEELGSLTPDFTFEPPQMREMRRPSCWRRWASQLRGMVETVLDWWP